MGAVSRANIRICGSHAGVSIGEDGPSQMGLEDIASFRATWSATVLYPCDANQTAQLVAQMADRDGIVYLRTTREKTPIIYSPDDRFPIGGSRVLRQSPADSVTLIGAGVTLHEALDAANRLAAEGISARVIDLYSIKPIDAATIRAAAADTAAIVTIEDHWPEGGLGEAVLSALAADEARSRVVVLAVRDMPASATPAEQRAAAGIDAASIVRAVHAAVGQMQEAAAT
jgi:transketolase